MEEKKTIEELTSIYVNSNGTVRKFNLNFDYAENYIEIFTDLGRIAKETDVSFNIASVNTLKFFKTFLKGVIYEDNYLLPHEKLHEGTKADLVEELEVLEVLLDSITSINGVMSVHENGVYTLATEKLEESIVLGRKLNNRFKPSENEEESVQISDDGLIKLEVIVED